MQQAEFTHLGLLGNAGLGPSASCIPLYAHMHTR